MTTKFISLDGEEWKDIDGFTGYQVSNKGRVRSCRGRGGHSKDWFLLTPKQDRYQVLCLTDNSGKQKYPCVHRLVAEAFIPNPLNLPVVMHKLSRALGGDDGVDNLEWGTSKQNKQDSVLDKTTKIGEHHPDSRVTEQDVLDIRAKYKTGRYLLKDLAKEYQITIQSIWAIVKYKTWKHVS